MIEKFIILFMIIFGIMFVSDTDSRACCSDGTQMIVLKIEGMTSGSCNIAVKIALRKLTGVAEVTANYKLGRAEIEYVQMEITPQQIIEAVNRIGRYKASIYKSKEGR